MSVWNEVTVNDKTYTVESSVIDSTTPPVQGNFRLNKITQQGEKKDKCALCCGYFEKTSVSFKVPNHRILHMQDSWGYIREGKRYANASFLYSLSKVCVFCSQLFSSADEEPIEAMSFAASTGDLKSTTAATIKSGKHTSGGASNNLTAAASQHRDLADDSEIKVNPTSGIQRNDVTFLQKAYQCSQVDQYNALFAVSKEMKYDARLGDGAIEFITDPIASEVARTRRGLDPWWEVELESKRHVHSITIGLCGPIHAKLWVSIFLLDEAVGFEDPFLDSMVKKALKWKEFVIPEQKENVTLVKCNWILPESSFGQAIRVQLRGIQTLSLSFVHAFQGNQIITSNAVVSEKASEEGGSSEDGGGGDEEKEDKKETNRKKDNTNNILNPYKNMQLQVRDSSFVTISPEFITNERLMMLSVDEKRKRIFKNDKKYIIPLRFAKVDKFDNHIEERYKIINEWLEKVRNFAQVFSSEEILFIYKLVFVNLIESKESFNKKDLESFDEEDLLGSCLICRNPRCDLLETVARIKQVFRWAQARSHIKLLGPLQSCELILAMCEGDLEHSFHGLQNECRNVQRVWESYHYTPANLEKRGVSWSQCLLLVSLFCKKQYFRVAPLVFSLGTDRLHEVPRDGDEESLSSKSSQLSIDEIKSLKDNQKAIDFLKGLGFDDAQDALTVGSIQARSPSDKKAINDINSLDKKAKPRVDPALELSKFKMNLLKKRDSKHLDFPKTLDLSFAATLVTGGRGNSTSKVSDSTLSSDAKDSKAVSATIVSSYVGSGYGNYDDEGHKEKELQRVCSCCNLHFPTSSMEIQVLWKHVIKLRRFWDPALVSKDIELLDNTISMYNLVYVCIFCAQYFDPDFEGGVAYPHKEGSREPVPQFGPSGNLIISPTAANTLSRPASGKTETRPNTTSTAATSALLGSGGSISGGLNTSSSTLTLNRTALNSSVTTLPGIASSRKAKRDKGGSSNSDAAGPKLDFIHLNETPLEKLIPFYDGRYPLGGLQEKEFNFNAAVFQKEEDVSLILAPRTVTPIVAYEDMDIINSNSKRESKSNSNSPRTYVTANSSKAVSPRSKPNSKPGTPPAEFK